MPQIILTMSAPCLYGYGATTGLSLLLDFQGYFSEPVKEYYADIVDMSILILALFFLFFLHE